MVQILLLFQNVHVNSKMLCKQQENNKKNPSLTEWLEFCHLMEV